MQRRWPSWRNFTLGFVNYWALPLPVEGAEVILTPPIVSLSPTAFQEWRVLHGEIEAELSRVGEFGSVPDIGAKVAENAARIAALFHVLNRGPGGDVDREMMERAASLSIWHLNEARRVVGATKTAQDIADAALLEGMAALPPGRCDRAA